jgi:drug/metabolite transporter (DMT)-like permease
VIAASSRVAPGWRSLVAVSILCSGLGAGVWRHAGIGAGKFCVLFVIGKAILVAAMWVRRRPPRVGRAWRAFVGCALLAALLNGLAWIAYLFALARGPLPMVQTITAAYTAIATVLAVLFLGERLTSRGAVGVALIVAAGLLLADVGEAGAPSARGSGWLAASFAATGAWGVSVVVCKRAYDLPDAEDRGFFLAQGLGLLVTLLPYGLVALARGEAHDAGSDAAALAVAALYLAGDFTLFAAIARGPATLVNPLSGLYPIPSIAYAALVLGEAPDRWGWLAIAMLLPGVALTAPRAGDPARGREGER